MGSCLASGMAEQFNNCIHPVRRLLESFEVGIKEMKTSYQRRHMSIRQTGGKD